MPMTDKPLRRVKGEQRNEIGRDRRNKTRRDSPVDIEVCGFSPPPSTQIGCTDPGGASAGGRLDHAYLPNFTDLLRDIA
jgi:hypothetical protein